MERWQWLALGILAALGLGGGYYVVTNRMQGPRWDRLLPQAKQAALALVQKANDAALDVMFWEGWRDPAESAANITKGTTWITDPYDSMHVWGLSFDIVFRDAAGFPSWPPATDPRWTRLGQLGESMGLQWGGRFDHGKHFDGPHFQLPGYSTTALKQKYGKNFLAFLQQSGVAVA